MTDKCENVHIHCMTEQERADVEQYLKDRFVPPIEGMCMDCWNALLAKRTLEYLHRAGWKVMWLIDMLAAEWADDVREEHGRGR